MTRIGSSKKIRLIMDSRSMLQWIPTTALSATTMTPASVNDTNYLPYCMVYSRHINRSIEKVYADRGYAGKLTVTFWPLIISMTALCEKTQPHQNWLNMKKIGIKRYQKFDTLLNNILGSAILTMALKEHGLPTSLKTNLMFGTARQHSIYQKDWKSLCASSAWFSPEPWRYIMIITITVKSFYDTTTRGSGLSRLIKIAQFGY